ncbi:MAG: cytochrome c peroxidase [Chitinophagales bacterium]
MIARKLLPLCFLAITAWSFTGNSGPVFPTPENWPPPQYSFANNPLSESKIKLGRMLFYDPILSRDSSISCASCHTSFNAFSHADHKLSHGIGDQIGTRNAPALINMAWAKSFMWDGAINHLDVQPLGPISNPIEMNESIAHVVEKLQRSPLYRRLFREAFHNDSITGEYALKAMSQFLVMLISDQSKYDSVMRHQSQFTAQEDRGYALYKKNCAACHTEPLFTNNNFENNGLPQDTLLRDAGRIKVTQRPEDSLRFKVPTLRNAEFSYPYMHDGRFKTLREVLQHYTSGIKHSATLSTHLQQPILLTENERTDLLAFLLTLTDRNFVFTEKFRYPRNIPAH